MRYLIETRSVTDFTKKICIGQGAFGNVYLGEDKTTKELVALKQINTMVEVNGFPMTSIREIKILQALSNANIVKLKEIVTSEDKNGLPKQVYMVFEYLEHDLKKLLESPEIKLTQDIIKSWIQQLLKGVHYMHTNKVIHRDLKTANILVNKRGELKIADWGLARSWKEEHRHLTTPVVTLWYRPPELLLGCVRYTPKIDIWSVGCIIVEIFRRNVFLRGLNEMSQLNLIFNLLGHPSLAEWPKIYDACPLWRDHEPKGENAHPRPRLIHDELSKGLPARHISWMTENAKSLIECLLAFNPQSRCSAGEAIKAEYFFEVPIVKAVEKLNMQL